MFFFGALSWPACGPTMERHAIWRHSRSHAIASPHVRTFSSDAASETGRVRVMRATPKVPSNSNHDYRLKDPKKMKLRSSYSMKQCLCMSHCVHMFIRFLCSGRGSDGGEEDITPIYFFFFVVLVGKRLCSTFHERHGPNPKPYGIDSRWRNFTRRTRLVAKRQCRPVL